MKIKTSLLLLAATLLAAGSAAAKEVVRVPAPEGVLPVVITEATIGNLGNAFTDFDRLDIALTKVAKERNWPVKLAVEKIASNTDDYLTQLEISLQRVDQQIPGEYLYRGFTTLWVNGQKHNFKIIEFRYTYRMGEQTDRSMEKLFLGAANATADKVEPLLFPDLNKKK